MVSSSASAQQKRIYIANDEHTDYFWTADGSTYETVFSTMIDYYLALADSTASNAPPYQSRFNCDGNFWLWTYERNRSAADFQKLMDRIKDGHISAPLTTLVSCYGGQPAEAVLRGMYYPGRLERRFDYRFNLAVSMENQTLPLGLASLWAGAGAKYSWRGVCGCASQVSNSVLAERPREIYWWQGKDDQRILLKWHSLYNGNNQGIGGYAEAFDPVTSINFLDTNTSFLSRYTDASQSGPYNVRSAFGFGWDALDRKTGQVYAANPTAFPLVDHFHSIAQAQTTVQRQVITSNEHDFFADFEATYGASLPGQSLTYGNEWELYSASMAETSAQVRRAVEKLRAAESMATLVSLQQPTFMNGRQAARDLAFQNLGLYWEHDWTADGPVPRSVRAIWQQTITDEITAYVNTLHSDAVIQLGSLIQKTGTATRFYVFNPLSWVRTDSADFAYTGSTNIHVTDLSTGTDVPHQIVTVNAVTYLRILATALPSVGYKAYEVRSGAGTAATDAAATVSASNTTLQNSLVKIVVDADGAIASLVNKADANAELAATIGGLKLNDFAASSTTGSAIVVENTGPVSVTLKCVSTAGKAHTTRITLYRNSSRVDVQNNITENFADVRHWGFSFNLTQPDVHTEEIGAVIRAKRQSDGGDYANTHARTDYLTLNHFADMSNGGNTRGITLSNADCAFAKLGSSTVTTLDVASAQLSVLAGGQVDGTGLGIQAQNGASAFLQRFALRAHTGYNQTAAMKFSMEHQNPPVTGIIAGSASSPYPASTYSYLAISDADLLLWALKPHDDGIGSGVVARVWNQAGVARPFTLSAVTGLLANAKKATHIETGLTNLTLSSGNLADTLAAQRMQTYIFNEGVITVPTAAPVITPNGGTTVGLVSVSLSSASSGASIRYTLDGSLPTITNGTLYTGPFSVAQSTTVKAAAYVGSVSSTLSTAGFTIAASAGSLLGNNSIGTTTDTLTDATGQFINVSRWQALTSFQATMIQAYVSALTGHYRAAIYADDGTGAPQPGALLGTASEVTNPSTGWQIFALPSSVSISSGSYYWLGLWSDTVGASIRAETSGGTVRYRDPATYTYASTFPNPLITTNQYNYRHSIYAASGPTLTAFDQWKQNFTLSPSLPAQDDTDADGSSLLLEYALGGNPTLSSTSILPSGTIDSSTNKFKFTFRRERADLFYSVEASNDLNIWTTLATNPGTTGQTVNVLDAVTLSAEPRRFMRLRVTQP